MTVRNRQTVNPEKLKADMEKIKALYDAKDSTTPRSDTRSRSRA